MKALFAVLFFASLAGSAVARPLPSAGPLEPALAPAAQFEGERVAIWYWGVLIGQPKFCWKPATGFSYGPC